MRRIPGGGGTVVAVLLCLALALTGCSGGDEESAPTPSESPTATSEAPSPEREVRINTLAGKVSKVQRRRAARQVSRVVDHWVQRAYAGSQPRTGKAYRKAFARFTPGATRRAWRQRPIMTNSRLSDRHQVHLLRRVLALDLLGNSGRPAAGTARFRVLLQPEGADVRHLVTGRLLLSRGPSGRWRVFGFDVTRENK